MILYSLSEDHRITKTKILRKISGLPQANASPKTQCPHTLRGKMVTPH